MSVLKSRSPLTGCDLVMSCPDAQLAADFHRLWNNPNIRIMFMPREHLSPDALELLVMLDHHQVNTEERKQLVTVLANIRDRLIRTKNHTEWCAHPLLQSLGGEHQVMLGAATDEPEYSLNLGQHSYQPRAPEGMAPPQIGRAHV